MKRLVVIDTETGGLDPAVHSILTLAAVVWEDGQIGDQFHVMIHEEQITADPEALSVNGLTVETVKSLGVSPSVAVTLFHDWLRKNGFSSRITMGGHNAAFDYGFLNRLYRLAQRKSPFSHRLVCTQVAASFLVLCGKLTAPSTGLNALTQQFGITIRAGGVNGKHDALEDATATAKLLTALVATCANTTMPDFRRDGPEATTPVS